MPMAPILNHGDWSTFKKAHKQENLSVSGVDVGKALDAYHAAFKPTLRALRTNIAAINTLHVTISKYLSKLPKDAKRPKAFDDGVADIRNAAKHNLDTFSSLQHEIDTFAQWLHSFEGKFHGLEMGGDVRGLEKCAEQDFLPPLYIGLKQFDMYKFVGPQLLKLKEALEECKKLLAAGDAVRALNGGSAANIANSCEKIIAILKPGLAEI